MNRCPSCPVSAGSTCVAMATNCRRLCELAVADPAYREHVISLSTEPAAMPSAIPFGRNASGEAVDPWTFVRAGRLAADTFRRVEHLLEWSWPNAGHGRRCGFDFDGILCRDTALGAMPLIDILPLYLPRRLPAPLIATGRGEECRDELETWLHKHGVRWDRLAMRPFHVPIYSQAIAAWKAEVYARSDCGLFAESDPEQARVIADLTGKAVLCPALGRVLPPSTVHGSPSTLFQSPSTVHQPPSTSLAAVFSCPHRNHCRCSTVECRGGKRTGQRVTLADCVECLG